MTKPMDRRTLLRTGALSAAAVAGGPLALPAAANPPQPGEKPNILWFTSEDNYPLIGAYGDTLARTPTIDLLARDGVLFEHAYSAAPVCGPSRFSILTGMHPAACGTAESFGSTDEVLPRHMRGYPSYFKDLGYYTANNQKKNYNSQFDYVLGMWDESSETAHWHNKAQGQPFFQVFNTFTTHESTLFNGRRNLFGEPAAGGRFTPEMMAGKIPPYLPDTDKVRTDFARFYNAMENMDRELAFRLRELEEAGVAEDTIVFYYSDNGGITPRGKRFCYDLGLHCPLVVYFPPRWQHLSAHLPGTRISDPVTFNDLMPTVLSLLGIAPPDHVHGRALFGPHAGEPMRYAVGGRTRMDERFDMIRSITDTRYRYIRNYMPHRPWGQYIEFMQQAGGYQDWLAMHMAGQLNEVQDRFWGRKPYEELYDLESDPHQIANLVDDPAAAEKLAELRTALDAHMVAINDNGLIPEGSALEGYANSRQPGAYPIAEAMAMAEAAASERGSLRQFLDGLSHDNEVIRYWAATGLLIAGERARPELAAIKQAMLNDPSPITRIVLAEALVALDDDRDGLLELGVMIDVEDDGPLRLFAINALDFLGEKARPVLPAIRRSLTEDHRSMRKVARHIVDKLDGTFDPYAVNRSPGGGIQSDPTAEAPAGAPRQYD